MRIVIPSKGRARSIQKAVRLFPTATLVVPEEEVEEYERFYPLEVVGHGPVCGIAEVRQWILDHFSDEVLVMVDDDISEVRCLVTPAGHVTQIRIRAPGDVLAILENAASIAKGIGAPLFGFNMSPSPVHFHPFDPFGFSGYIEGVVGFIGRQVRYDLNLRTRGEDIDICLQALLKHRVIWIDRRFCFVHTRNVNTGGLSEIRSSKREREELEYLKKKWGKYLVIQRARRTERLKLRVPRRQKTQL